MHSLSRAAILALGLWAFTGSAQAERPDSAGSPQPSVQNRVAALGIGASFVFGNRAPRGQKPSPLPPTHLTREQAHQTWQALEVWMAKVRRSTADEVVFIPGRGDNGSVWIESAGERLTVDLFEDSVSVQREVEFHGRHAAYRLRLMRNGAVEYSRYHPMKGLTPTRPKASTMPKRGFVASSKSAKSTVRSLAQIPALSALIRGVK